MNTATRVIPEPSDVQHPRELVKLLQEAGPDTPTHQLQWLERLITWVRRAERPHQDWLLSRDGPASTRVRLLLAALSAEPAWSDRLRRAVCTALQSTSAVALLADVGVDRDRGLWSAVAGRFSRRVFPHAPRADDLRPVLRQLLRGDGAADWVEALDESLLRQLRAQLDPGGDTFAAIASAIPEAIVLLGAQASSMGLSLSTAVGAGLSRQSPFWELPRACDVILAADSPSSREEARHRLAGVLLACRQLLESESAAHERGPVETQLVLRGHVLRDALTRIEELTSLPASSSAVRSRAQLLASLIRAQSRYEAMGALWAKAWRPLSRRILEHTSTVGRHYITRNREQWHRMVAAGAGGGAVTIVTASMKLVIASAGLSLFFSGLAASANYALSFLLIQLCGFALATKQPSMTGAALAAAVDLQTADGARRKLAQEIAVVLRSQAASVLGNLGLVVPGAVLVQWLSMQAGHPILDLDHARHVIESIDPLHPTMLPFALFTGLLLWLSSMAGGWIENWARCRRIPEALAHHRGLTALVGADRTRRFASWIDHHLCGIGSNLALGLLLGMVPAVAQFFGLGLEVRHVTLSAGSLGFAGAAVGAAGVLEPQFLRAMSGIGVIAVANLGVSFALGLGMALRARGLGAGRVPLLRAFLDGVVMAIRPRPPAYVRLLAPASVSRSTRR